MNESAPPLLEDLQLSPVEARILGCLIEKESATPEQYPLTQNAVQVACNQKTSRDPVMQLEPGEVGHALRQMENRKLIRSQHGSRAQRYEHRCAEAYSVTRQQQAALAVMLLRGPQTLAEILSRSDRLASFADQDDLKHAIDRLIQRDAPLALRIPKGPGQREDRYMHLLCGPVDIDALSASIGAARNESAAERSDLLERLDALEARVQELEERLAAPR